MRFVVVICKQLFISVNVRPDGHRLALHSGVLLMRVPQEIVEYLGVGMRSEEGQVPSIKLKA